MRAAVRGLVLLLGFSFSASYLLAQTGSEDAIFTIAVTAPTPAKDVQLRYFLTDQAGVAWRSTVAVASDDKVVIRADTTGRVPKTLNAIAYAPGCQFVTFSAEDLTTSPREGEFQCQKLPTVELRGTIAKAPTQQQLQVQSMYVVRWAGKFFADSGVSISPLLLNKSTVEADGTFSMELPDFTSDPLWNSLSNDASLIFFLVDPATGHRVAELKPAAVFAPNGSLKVASSYPEVTFKIRKNTTKQAKATQ
jgi:hypothetical protein